MKDLRLLLRDLSRVIVADDTAATFQLNPANAIHISRWHNYMVSDRQLEDIYQKVVRACTLGDVRHGLR